MSSFNRQDYKNLFKLGRRLYLGENTPKRVGTILMAMSESVIGQQVPWPNIHPRYRHLTTYPPTVIKSKDGE